MLIIRGRTNRTYHWSQMQTKKFQPEGKRIIPQTRFIEFPGIIRWHEGWYFSVCIIIFNALCKQNNQTSVSDTDPEIPTRGWTDNAGNEVYLVSGIIRWSELGFLSLHRRSVFDYLFLPMAFKIVIYLSSLFYFWYSMSHNDLLRTSFGVFRGAAKVTSLLKFRVLMSLLTSRVRCFSP